MRVFVISLDRSKTRRETVSASLIEAGVPFEIARAVDGRAGEHHIFPHYNEREMLQRTGKMLSVGEVGCFASHYRLWQACVELGQPIAVLEDDVVVAPDFAKALALAGREVARHQLIRLFTIKKRRHAVLAELEPPFQLIRYMRGPFGMQAYVLSPTGAQSLLDNAARWLAPVDRYLESPWLHGIDMIAMTPFRVSLGSLPSEIKVRDGKGAGVVNASRRGIGHLRSHLAQAMFNLSRG